MKFFIIHVVSCCSVLMFQAPLNAMTPSTCTLIPPLFKAIYANNVSKVIKIVSEKHDIIYSFYVTKTPIQYALECNSIDIFTYLLAQDNLTHTSDNTTLLSHAVAQEKIMFIKTLLSSGKLLCQFSKEFDPTLEVLKNMPERSQLYDQIGFNETMRLLTYASRSKESLCEKLPSKAIEHNNYPALKQWIFQKCPLKDSKPFSFMAFYCPALSDIFANMFTENIISLIDLKELTHIDFEYALMARNTCSILTLRQKLLENGDYEPAKTIATNLHGALQTQKALWEPYVQELEEATLLFQHKYDFMVYTYKKVLNQNHFSDSIIITLT